MQWGRSTFLSVSRASVKSEEFSLSNTCESANILLQREYVFWLKCSKFSIPLEPKSTRISISRHLDHEMYKPATYTKQYIDGFLNVVVHSVSREQENFFNIACM